MTAFLPRAGFAVGQTIPILIQWETSSSLDVSSLKIKLVTAEIYMLPERNHPLHHAPCCTESNHLEKDIIKRREQTTLVERVITITNSSKEIEYNFEIPRFIDVSDLLYSQTINIEHAIEIVVYGKHMLLKPKIYIPIVIGSVPKLKPGQEMLLL